VSGEHKMPKTQSHKSDAECFKNFRRIVTCCRAKPNIRPNSLVELRRSPSFSARGSSAHLYLQL